MRGSPPTQAGRTLRTTAALLATLAVQLPAPARVSAGLPTHLFERGGAEVWMPSPIVQGEKDRRDRAGGTIERSNTPSATATDAATREPDPAADSRSGGPPDGVVVEPVASTPYTTASLAALDDSPLIVVLDPGHGGDEMGAEGKKGIVEKEVTLDVSKRLKAILERESGLTVLLTRDTDIAIPLDERTALANQIHAGLFLSIHVNSAARRDARGAETYFLTSKARDEEIRTLAAIENNAAGVDRAELAESSGSLELVLWDLAQSLYLEESSDLAEAIQKELNDALGVKDRGIKQAPFRVLMGATMPAVLVEIGFLSNPTEEASLAEGIYRDRIAEALARAILAFRSSPKAQRMAAPPSTR